MRRISIYIAPLLILAGCATTQGPEPVISETAARPEQPLAKHRQVPAEARTPEPRQVVTPPAMGQAEETPAAPRTEPQVTAKATVPAHTDLSVAHQKIGEPPTENRGWARLAETNDNKLINVYKGMDRATVEIIMASAHNPFKREKINGANGQTYEVLFYLTREPRKGHPVTERYLTPVIFLNSEVVAMGNFHLKKLRTTGLTGLERKSRSHTK